LLGMAGGTLLGKGLGPGGVWIPESWCVRWDVWSRGQQQVQRPREWQRNPSQSCGLWQKARGVVSCHLCPALQPGCTPPNPGPKPEAFASYPSLGLAEGTSQVLTICPHRPGVGHAVRLCHPAPPSGLAEVWALGAGAVAKPGGPVCPASTGTGMADAWLTAACDP
jgi:hypothetical protein